LARASCDRKSCARPTCWTSSSAWEPTPR